MNKIDWARDLPGSKLETTGRQFEGPRPNHTRPWNQLRARFRASMIWYVLQPACQSSLFECWEDYLSFGLAAMPDSWNDASCDPIMLPSLNLGSSPIETAIGEFPVASLEDNRETQPNGQTQNTKVIKQVKRLMLPSVALWHLHPDRSACSWTPESREVMGTQSNVLFTTDSTSAREFHRALHNQSTMSDAPLARS